MKTKIEAAIFAILLTTMLLTPVFALGIGNGVGSTPSNPHAADAMWIEINPGVGGDAVTTDTGASPPGTMFNITVVANITENVFAYQVALGYNRSWLAAINAGFTAPSGTSMLMNGHSTAEAGPTIDTSFLGNGSVLATESCKGTDFVTGPVSGTLIWIEFKILSGPYKTTFTSLFNITTQYASGKDFVENPALTKLTLTPSDATLTYKWAPPTTTPYLGIEHDTGFGVFPPTSSSPDTWPLVWPNVPPNPLYKYINTNGSGFNAFLYVKNIDPAWGMNTVWLTLKWNATVLDGTSFTPDSHWTVVSSSLIAGELDVNLTSFTGSGTKVPIGTLNFTVLLQETIPPYPSGWTDVSSLVYSNYGVTDPTGTAIPTTAAESGNVIINALITLKLPNLYVSPATITIGPSPSIGTTFTVNIDVASLTKSWHDVAIQTRLAYDDSILALTGVSEGDFMTNPIWDLYPSPGVGTFFYYLDQIGGDLIYPYTHVLLLDLLLPNKTSGIYTQSVMPNTIESKGVDPTVFTLTFQVLQQNCFDQPNIVTYLNLLPFWQPTDKTFIDWNGKYISSNPGVNGTVIIESLNEVNRQIDLFGGPVNDGYGKLVGLPTPYGYDGYGLYVQLPAPYGGQGPNAPMDLAFPQTQIYLNAYLTYNYWPVQMKDVGFEVEGPFIHVSNTGNLTADYVPAPSYQIWAKFTATTDPNGVATYTYRMPWPCDDPDAITGVWKITATATVADQVVSDIMMFYYQRPVYIWKVTTDAYGYFHDSYVTVTVTYGTHSIEMYPVLFSAVLTDNLSVPVGMALYQTCVGGTVFCTWLNSSFQVTIYIPKWAYAGDGYIEVSAFDKDPTVGGEAYDQQYTPAPEINIYPYNTPLQFVPTTGITTDNTGNWDTVSPILTAITPGTSGFANTWYNLWPTDKDMSIVDGDQIGLAAVAIGGYPAMLPGDIPVYTFAWYVNGTLVHTDSLVTSSSITLTAGIDFTVVGTYNIQCVVTDKLGTSVSSTLQIYVHHSDAPPGP